MCRFDKVDMHIIITSAHYNSDPGFFEISHPKQRQSVILQVTQKQDFASCFKPVPNPR